MRGFEVRHTANLKSGKCTFSKAQKKGKIHLKKHLKNRAQKPPKKLKSPVK
jgi:hypothetical protein